MSLKRRGGRTFSDFWSSGNKLVMKAKVAITKPNINNC